jgi:hypothetical protein
MEDIVKSILQEKLAQLESMQPLPRISVLESGPYQEWLAQNKRIQHVVNEAEFEALPALPDEIWDLICKIRRKASALYQ